LLIEPDFLRVSIAEPPEIRAFWTGWLSWSRKQGVDYMIGRRLPRLLAALGLEKIAATAETALYNGGSRWAADRHRAARSDDRVRGARPAID
jgi:hypothetical protein